jgi:hypothetical protein
MGESLIRLDTDETIPVITHYRICAYRIEVPRDDKPGYMEVYLARCYIKEDAYYEDPRLTGGDLMIKVNFQEFLQFINTPTTGQGILKDSMDLIAQFLIDMGYVHGTVVDVDGARG